MNLLQNTNLSIEDIAKNSGVDLENVKKLADVVRN